jgi:hypothetical protein
MTACSETPLLCLPTRSRLLCPSTDPPRHVMSCGCVDGQTKAVYLPCPDFRLAVENPFWIPWRRLSLCNCDDTPKRS